MGNEDYYFLCVSKETKMLVFPGERYSINVSDYLEEEREDCNVVKFPREMLDKLRTVRDG